MPRLILQESRSLSLAPEADPETSFQGPSCLGEWGIQLKIERKTIQGVSMSR